MMEKKKPRDPSDASARERTSRRTEDGTLGYAQDAGHPGGEQDLDAKSETEEEHGDSR